MSEQSIFDRIRQLISWPRRSSYYQYALEGIRDIDANNPARIYFHIRGRQLTAVTLYLRAERFSPLYYTELVEHTHNLDGDTSSGGKHEHTINMMVSSPATVGWLPDRPGSSVFSNQVPVAFETQKLLDDKFSHRIIQGNEKVDIEVDGDPNATHERYPILAFTGEMTIPPGYEGWTDEDSDWDGWDYAGRSYEQDREDDGGHTHLPLPVGARGQEKPREGQQLSYVNNLQVWVDGVGLTAAILAQIQDANPTEHWNNVLGDGTKDHPLVVPHDEPPRRRDGTGPIRLDSLPNTNFTEGEHYITLRVEELTDEDGNDLGNGGRIHYNLYVA
jgi:hypothetical protein